MEHWTGPGFDPWNTRLGTEEGGGHPEGALAVKFRVKTVSALELPQIYKEEEASWAQGRGSPRRPDCLGSNPGSPR